MMTRKRSVRAAKFPAQPVLHFTQNLQFEKSFVLMFSNREPEMPVILIAFV